MAKADAHTLAGCARGWVSLAALGAAALFYLRQRAWIAELGQARGRDESARLFAFELRCPGYRPLLELPAALEAMLDALHVVTWLGLCAAAIWFTLRRPRPAWGSGALALLGLAAACAAVQCAWPQLGPLDSGLLGAGLPVAQGTGPLRALALASGGLGSGLPAFAPGALWLAWRLRETPGSLRNASARTPSAKGPWSAMLAVATPLALLLAGTAGLASGRFGPLGLASGCLLAELIARLASSRALPAGAGHTGPPSQAAKFSRPRGV